jgi:hypothetical protein
VLTIRLRNDAVHIGKRFSVTFQRTLRIPDDGRVYPLPPGLGRMPVVSAQPMRGAPAEWRHRHHVVVPLHRREALWLGFDGAFWKPNAVQVAVGGVNAVSGGEWPEPLSSTPQNYVVTPDQPWLDGINAGTGVIRQFVAVPLGEGKTIEGQVTGTESAGGLQIRVFEPKPGRFPDIPPRSDVSAVPQLSAVAAAAPMGLGAGGTLRQKIYTDTYGLDTWDQMNWGEVYVHLVPSEEFRILSGREPPPTPISASTYAEHGLPWFDLYDEDRPEVPTSERLEAVKSLRELDGNPPETSVTINSENVLGLRPSPESDALPQRGPQDSC